jgi:hypothetical protein
MPRILKVTQRRLTITMMAVVTLHMYCGAVLGGPPTADAPVVFIIELLEGDLPLDFSASGETSIASEIGSVRTVRGGKVGPPSLGFGKDKAGPSYAVAIVPNGEAAAAPCGPDDSKWAAGKPVTWTKRVGSGGMTTSSQVKGVTRYCYAAGAWKATEKLVVDGLKAVPPRVAELAAETATFKKLEDTIKALEDRIAVLEGRQQKR